MLIFLAAADKTEIWSSQRVDCLEQKPLRKGHTMKDKTLGAYNIGDRREMVRRGWAVPAMVVFWSVTMNAALAQSYPTRPIRFVTTSGPDVVPRLLGQKFTAAWGQQVLVDPQAGGGGTVSASVVAKGPADGGAGSARLGAWMRPGSGP